MRRSVQPVMNVIMMLVNTEAHLQIMQTVDALAVIVLALEVGDR